MQRFIKVREVPMKVPVKDGQEEKTVMVPQGYWIGPGKRSVLRQRESHFGRPESYYKKPNTIKSKRNAEHLGQ